MTITLSPDQLAWIEAHVASGDFADADEAVRCLIADAIAERDDLDHDDLSWAKPLIDEALAEVERGEAIVIKDIDAYLAATFHPEKE